MTDDFRHRTSLRVRFRDIDAFGHVNNAVFVSYVEQARVRYLIDVLGLDPRNFASAPLILARLEIDFRAPIFLDEEVTVASRVERIGRSSFAMSHRVTAGTDASTARPVADVESVLVAYDYAAGRPMPVPDTWRALMAAHEGRSLVADAPQPAAATT